VQVSSRQLARNASGHIALHGVRVVLRVPERVGRAVDVVEVPPERQDELAADQLAGVRRDHAQQEDAVLAQELVDKLAQRHVVHAYLARVVGRELPNSLTNLVTLIRS